MPKRVHSASDRDDDAESSQHLNASKRTRKTPQLVSEVSDWKQYIYRRRRPFVDQSLPRILWYPTSLQVRRRQIPLWTLSSIA